MPCAPIFYCGMPLFGIIGIMTPMADARWPRLVLKQQVPLLRTCRQIRRHLFGGQGEDLSAEAGVVAKAFQGLLC